MDLLVVVILSPVSLLPIPVPLCLVPIPVSPPPRNLLVDVLIPRRFLIGVLLTANPPMLITASLLDLIVTRYVQVELRTLPRTQFPLTVLIVLFTLLTPWTHLSVLVLTVPATVLIQQELFSGLIMLVRLDLQVMTRRACRVTAMDLAAGSVRVLLWEPARRDRALFTIVVVARRVI